MTGQTGKVPGRPASLQPEGPRLSSNTGQRLKTDLDDLLDEIDSVLERNAAAFHLIEQGGIEAG